MCTLFFPRKRKLHLWCCYGVEKKSMNIQIVPRGAEVVWRTLDVEKQYQHANVTGDLHSLSSIKGSSTWDFSLPTISVVKHDHKNTKSKIYSCSNCVEYRREYPTVKEFQKEFFELIPELVNFDMINLCVAGGLPSFLVNPFRHKEQKHMWNDVDIFVYGLSKEKADEKVQNVIDHILQYWISKKCSYHIFRTAHVITLQKNNSRQKIQIIFRLYNTISEILHGFDMGSCSIGFDGENVHMTSNAKFSLEYMCNIVDTSKMSTSYVSNLIKYANQGFRLILPYFEIPSKYEKIEMPHFSFITHGTIANNISVFNITNTSETSNYESNCADYIFSGNTNMKKLNNMITNKETENNLLYYSGNNQCKTGKDVFNLTPNFLDLDKYFSNIGQHIWNESNGTLGYRDLQKYCPEETLQWISTFFSENDTPEKRTQAIQNLLKSRKEIMEKMIKNFENNPPEWITDNYESQFNSAKITIEDFYGIYLRKNFISEPVSDKKAYC